MKELKYRIEPADQGWSVRQIALRRLLMSCGQFKRAKFRGEILLDGRRVRANERVCEGQWLLLRVPEEPKAAVTPHAIPLTIPYADSDFWIVDKPAPLPSTPSSRKDAVTLENALFAWLGCPADFIYRPVNRLDKGTSGLMLAARSAHAQHRLQALLHTDGFIREYLAVCEGCPAAPEGVIDLPIGKADGATVRREVRPDGKPARTRYQVLEAGNRRSLLRLRLETGRTHQIRVHLRALGCPVAGDFLYGTELSALPGRFALHSHRVQLQHPLTGQALEIKSPLPDALAALLKP